MKKSNQAAKTQDWPHRISIVLSIGALFMSGASLWVANDARHLSYEASLPEISATVELASDLAPEKQIQLKVRLDNFGKTPAKQMNTVLQYKFQRRDIPFEPTYPDNPDFVGPTADLAPSNHTTLYSTNSVSLAHDHDVAAVASGLFRFYVYGKSTYKDVMGGDHEFHMCRFYEKVASAEDLKLSYCDSYNDSR